MSTLDTIKAHKSDLQTLAQKYGIRSIRVFGSVAREEDAADSDCDFLADFEEGRSLFDLLGFKEDAEKLLAKKIDVLTSDSLHWSIKDKILSESIVISDE